MGRASDAKERLMDAVQALIWEGSYGSTTIDDICEKAGVKKGSFYYFFDSKCDLAVTALDREWETFKPQLDAVFSPALPPVDRLRKLFKFMYDEQAEMKAQCGHVLGCPLCTLGSEVSTQEERLRAKVQELLGYWPRYLETTIRDAHAEGSLDAPDAAKAAQMVFVYLEGLLAQARIQNNLDVLKQAESGAFALLGMKQEKVAA
jgi:TetR/AcrR family transcriptional repressor of nem operon